MGSFLFPDGSFDQNVVIFGVHTSSSVHADNKKKQIFWLLLKVLHKDEMIQR